MRNLIAAFERRMPRCRIHPGSNGKRAIGRSNRRAACRPLRPIRWRGSPHWDEQRATMPSQEPASLGDLLVCADETEDCTWRSRAARLSTPNAYPDGRPGDEEQHALQVAIGDARPCVVRFGIGDDFTVSDPRGRSPRASAWIALPGGNPGDPQRSAEMRSPGNTILCNSPPRWKTCGAASARIGRSPLAYERSPCAKHNQHRQHLAQ